MVRAPAQSRFLSLPKLEIRNELSFTSFHHGGFTEGADSDLTDAELRAAGRHSDARSD
jgi:hypothetical protein